MTFPLKNTMSLEAQFPGFHRPESTLYYKIARLCIQGQKQDNIHSSSQSQITTCARPTHQMHYVFMFPMEIDADTISIHFNISFICVFSKATGI